MCKLSSSALFLSLSLSRYLPIYPPQNDLFLGIPFLFGAIPVIIALLVAFCIKERGPLLRKSPSEENIPLRESLELEHRQLRTSISSNSWYAQCSSSLVSSSWGVLIDCTKNAIIRHCTSLMHHLILTFLYTCLPHNEELEIENCMEVMHVKNFTRDIKSTHKWEKIVHVLASLVFVTAPGIIVYSHSSFSGAGGWYFLQNHNQ